MDLNEGTTTEDLWTPFKELVAVVECYLTNESGSSPYAVHTFESVLRRHKQTFLSLLKNPAKNPASRDEIKRGIIEGVNLPSVGRTLLSKDLVDEAIIISDMYNANEYACLELLHSAQRQSPRQPGLARGLLAVMLYYDGRRALVQALKELVMARDGVSWSINAREEIIQYVSRYVEQLISDGLLANVLDALHRNSLDNELDLLRRNRALPPSRYHMKLLGCMQTTRKLLAGVIFAASAQRGLERDVLLMLLSQEMSSPSRSATGALDETSLALQMALLYALDLSVLHRREDGEELSKKLPLIQDPDLISVLLDELTPVPHQEGQKGSGLRALCQLALGLALSALKRAPVSLLRKGNESRCEALDQDEMLVDAAIDGEVFEYLDEMILSSDLVANEEYYQRRIHSLITDFIVLMHSKLMEMRVKADEAARAAQMYAAEGLAPPPGSSQRTRLDALLRCVERLYARDPHNLRNDYWLACDATAPSHRAGGRAATLYKFVRLSGEVMVAALLPAYLRALAAITVEKHTWALLARRDALSAHHLLTALALYHRNLRQDPTPFAEHAHASSLGASAIITPGARSGRLLVRQEEVEAMIGALKLIAAVAKVDEAACIAICENMQWNAVNCMFGLICCHVPIQLKSALCTTLAALGKWGSTAPRVWAALEAAQLVSVANDKRALTADLLEVECRMEQYPLSRAFLSLLDSLCLAGPLPRALGAGARHPGLDPYVDHVVNKLALPAPHRPYTDPQDKWQMISLCFRLFVRWLDTYEPSAADFPPPHCEPDSNPPPGFRLLMFLHTNSELLRMVLNTLDEAYDLMDKQPLTEQVFVQETLVSTLHILERALSLERALTAAATEANRAVMLVGLSKLILAPSGPEKTDRLVTCCLVLQHGCMVPAAAARAVTLLCRALHSPHCAKHLLECVALAHQRAPEVRHGFVECLEAEEWCGGDEAAADIRAAKEGIIVLLMQLLPAAPHNFAHFLLGYQLNDDVSRSALHEAGVAGSPRTCFHSILDILDAYINKNGSSDREATTLIESCYRLLYRIVERPATSPPALRLLRAREYFLARHVKATVNLDTASMATLSSRSWVLRACACEAGSAGSARQHAALSALLNALMYAQHKEESRKLPLPLRQDWESCVIRTSLEALPVSVTAVSEPRWELFHASQLRHAITECDLATGLGGKRISVTRVHALLSRELASLRASAPQRSMVAVEIQKVLDYVTEINKQRNLAATLTHYYDSWRQLTEIIFCVAPHDLLSIDARKTLLLNILQDLLNKIPPAEVLPQIGNLASGTVLLLLVNLRHCYILQKRESNLKSSEFETTFFGPSNQIMQTKSLTLKFILHKILSWILVSGGSTQKMRVNLYGALLNFLNIVNLKPSAADPEEEISSSYVSRLDSSKSRSSKEESSLKSMVIEVINSFGENLCAIMCCDCVGGGHDVCRMVALSCLDTLIEINPGTDWMNTLTNQGYLRSLIDSLLQDDEGLREALEPKPKSLRVLYVYESKMTLLIKIAGSRLGAETVLAQGALSCLANLKALDCHPDIHTGYGSKDTDFVPSVANRFRQMLVPALTLCDALLTTLGSQNHSCVLHITHLLLSHLECVDMVLRATHPNSPQGLLIEAAALTSVIARTSDREVFSAIQSDTALQRSGAALQRVHALMLTLLARFHVPPADIDSSDDCTLYYKIVCNLLLFARNTIESEAFSTNEGARRAGSAALDLLQHLLRRLHSHSKLLATVHHQLHSVPSMTLVDMKKLLGDESTPSSPLEARAAVISQLRARADLRRREVQYCSHAMHSALYLLWAHTRIYLRAAFAAPTNKYAALSRTPAVSVSVGEESIELRKALVTVFNDRFVDELIDTTKNQSQLQRGFLEVLVKDIKTMIQFSPV
ncbi:nuclear pore complex protein Nup205 [Pieris brassicae]|uniref:nuclear pore complex protein Nup205 n=1 Tax=Pieris brassicae TaxID=7116 RepID=UPI001E65FA9E|nr:nuclear pore complex protein Nup205 [Pieris brassicae]